MEENTNQNIETTDTETEIQEQSKTFTEKEMQAEIDRRVSQALKTQQKKYEKQLSLSNLDEQQRKEAEKNMRIEELEQQLADFEATKNRSEIKSVLSSRGLPVEFADMVHIGSDYDEALKNIDAFDKAFKAAVSAEVKRRLATSNPQVGTSSEALDFGKMSLTEKQRLYNTNPELYRKLAGK